MPSRFTSAPCAVFLPGRQEAPKLGSILYNASRRRQGQQAQMRGDEKDPAVEVRTGLFCLNKFTVTDTVTVYIAYRRRQGRQARVRGEEKDPAVEVRTGLFCLNKFTVTVTVTITVTITVLRTVARSVTVGVFYSVPTESVGA
jgi:hypothetical protein